MRLTGMRPRSGLLVAAVTVAVLGVNTTTALASCVMPPGSLAERLQASETVFVGSVVSTDARGSVANVAVESVWRGDVDDHVVVSGAEGGAGTVSSVDRSYEHGRRYLFVPWRGSGGQFRDNSCTDTRPWRARYAALRPGSATDVTSGPSPTSTGVPADGSDVAIGSGAKRPPGLLVVTAAAAIIAIASLAAIVGRRRTGP